MIIDFSGRTVLVTGSTGGIGFAAARGYLAAGAEVIINGRRPESVDAALERLGDARSAARGFAGDLSLEASVRRLVSEHPHVDVVVNNIGVYGPSDFFDTTDAEWTRLYETNVMSGVRIARAYAPGMVSRGWGRVVFVSSESAINVPTDMIHYGMTKAAQLAVSRGLAKRLAGTGVTVNAVLPGPTLSEGVAAMLTDGDSAEGRDIEELAREFVSAHRGSSLIGRAATVDEVANMILYVSSEQASATTGAALRVDGGVIENIV